MKVFFDHSTTLKNVCTYMYLCFIVCKLTNVIFVCVLYLSLG